MLGNATYDPNNRTAKEDYKAPDVSCGLTDSITTCMSTSVTEINSAI